MLYSKFNDKPYDFNFWGQIKRIKEILSQDKFSKFGFSKPELSITITMFLNMTEI